MSIFVTSFLNTFTFVFQAPFLGGGGVGAGRGGRKARVEGGGGCKIMFCPRSVVA